jgi:basic membrane lipoprotein Med (substrate-binding protein (PBP1-ABC) superfamily)
VVVSSAIAKWDPVIDFLVDEWWNHEAKGVPYNAPMEMLRFGMKDGGSEMAPYHALGAKIPDQVKNEVEKKKKAMKDGTFKTPLNEKMVTAK